MRRRLADLGRRRRNGSITEEAFLRERDGIMLLLLPKPEERDAD